MNPQTQRDLIDEYNQIPWEPNNTVKILKTDFLSTKNQLLFKITFENSTDSLLFSVCDFTSIKSVPFSDSPLSISSIELVLNTKKLRVFKLPIPVMKGVDTLNASIKEESEKTLVEVKDTVIRNENKEEESLEDIFSCLFGRLITPESMSLTHKESKMNRNDFKENKRRELKEGRGIISLTYENTYFFLRIHKYAFKNLNKVNLRNAGPHLTLRLDELRYKDKAYTVQYPHDKLKGNNVGKTYVQKSLRRYKNGKTKNVFVKGGGEPVRRDSPIYLKEKECIQIHKTPSDFSGQLSTDDEMNNINLQKFTGLTNPLLTPSTTFNSFVNRHKQCGVVWKNI